MPTASSGKDRACRAFKATRALGLPDQDVTPVLRQLLKVFDKNWELIEAENYRALIDACLDSMETKEVEENKNGLVEHDASKRPSKRPNLGVQEDQSSFTMDNGSLKLNLEKNEISILESSRQHLRDNRIESGSLSCSQGKIPRLTYVPSGDMKSTSGSASSTVDFNLPVDEPGSSNSQKESHKRELITPKTEQSIIDLPLGKSISKIHPDCYKIKDITKGMEKVKISLVDEFGNGDLPKFTYMPQNLIYQNAYVPFSLARIADEDCCSSCSGDCLAAPFPCACAQETAGEFAYTREGLLKEEFLRACISMQQEPAKHPRVYCHDCPLEKYKNEYFPEKCKGHLVRKFIKECWTKCGCDMKCGNRVVQRGITCKLQVFLTREGKGWGVRALQDLPKGAFVCEYVGEILTNTELYERNMQSRGNERHTYPVTLDADWGSEKNLRDDEALCLDATFCGNVARFINHRCNDANLIEIPVEVETPDRHYYHLAFFTRRKVGALEELTWDYNIDFDDDKHPIKAFQCCCGSETCRDKKRKGGKSKTVMLR